MKNTVKRLSVFILTVFVLSALLAVGTHAEELSPAVVASQEAQNKELMPALVILAIAFVVEIVDIAILTSIKKKVDALLGAPKKTMAIAPATLLAVTFGLLVVDLAMGIYIVYMVAVLFRAFAKLEEQKKHAKKRSAPKPTPAPKPEPKPKPAPKPEPKPKPVFVFESNETHTHIANPVAAVSVDKANEMMSDEEAISYEHFAAEFAADPDFNEEYTGSKKAEINVDTISQNYEAGERVTLNTLKEKKLVSANAGYVKVLARGTLNKPLDFAAQNFSVAAVKMIILTGGSVTVVDPSPEIAER